MTDNDKEREMLDATLNAMRDVRAKQERLIKLIDDEDAMEREALNILSEMKGSATMAAAVFLGVWFADGLCSFKLWNDPSHDESWYLQFGPDVIGPTGLGEIFAYLLHELDAATSGAIRGLEIVREEMESE